MLQAAYCNADHASSERIWTFSRPTAWKHVKRRMVAIGVPADVAKPKALRHGFGVAAIQQRIALSLVKKWLGHAKIETTAIYADPVGDEERALARLMWRQTPLIVREATNDELAKHPP
jgi:integrase/recombinase XerD